MSLCELRREGSYPPAYGGAAAVAASYDVQALRAAEFPWAHRGEATYLDHAYAGSLPVRTLVAMGDILNRRSAPFRTDPALQPGILARSRALAAQLINATPGEIACMGNTTYGLNLAARALRLGPGDVVLAHDREFPANVYPWMALERQGVRFELIPTRDGLPDEAALLRALDRPGVRAVTASWVSFATGSRIDVAALGHACRERGIYFVLDAIQGLGAAVLDVQTCPVDILACGGHKWLLGPTGSGFVYVRRDLVQQLEPDVIGWMSVQASAELSRLVDYDLTFHDDARRFEVLTLPYHDFAGLNASMELLLELGPDAVARHIEQLVDCAVEWAREEPSVRLLTPAEAARRAGIVALAPSDPAAASERLRRARITHSLREGAIRLSPHCYNTMGEMERALRILAGQRAT
ncbi:MAG TPA: aminotransferase class V-fold PLP-dependent enzyme [Gemmatimonadales bacterium]|nr:aminotransferase class V-fold PLP-dependent enzyme [Gemmatimonadales bacterium]